MGLGISHDLEDGDGHPFFLMPLEWGNWMEKGFVPGAEPVAIESLRLEKTPKILESSL